MIIEGERSVLKRKYKTVFFSRQNRLPFFISLSLSREIIAIVVERKGRLSCWKVAIIHSVLLLSLA